MSNDPMQDYKDMLTRKPPSWDLRLAYRLRSRCAWVAQRTPAQVAQRIRQTLIVLAYVCIFACAVLGQACATSAPEIRTRTIEVKVPVPVATELPPEFLVPVTPTTRIIWITPASHDASSCLAAPGEQSLARLLLDYRAREIALRAWAGAP